MYKSEHIITSKHYLILVSLAFLLGVFIALRVGTTLAFLLSAVISCLIFCIDFIFILAKKIAFKKKFVLLPLFLIIFLFLGVLRVFFIDFSASTSLKKYAGQELWLYGTLSSEPQLTKSEYYHTFELDVFKAGDDTSVKDTIVVYLPSTHKCDFHAGDKVFFWGSLNPCPERENVRSYEYYNSLRGKNIFLTANTKNINPLSDYSHFSLWSSVKQYGSYFRTKISDASEKLFPHDLMASAILKGILIGDKSGFTDKLYEKFSNSGISHIVSVSGLHVSILFSFLMVAFGLFGIRRKILMLVAVPFILIFMSASAFSASILRASVMVLIMILAFLLNEEYHPLTALFLAVSIIVAVAPYALFSKGLVLSFFATFGIFVYFSYFYNAISLPFASGSLSNKCPKIIKKSVSYLASSLALSLSSLLGTAYFLLIFFGKISKVQFLTNLWIIPLVSIIFCLGYIACIFIYILPGISLYILKYPLMWCLEVIKYTLNIFGDNKFAFNFPFDIKSLSYAAIYFGGCFMIYMFLKTIHDIHKQKNQQPKN